MLIEILAFPGFDELDALGPLEVLRNAAGAGADLQVRLVAVGSVQDIRGAHGLRVGVDGMLGSHGRPELLVIPGGGWVVRAEHGARAEAERRIIPAAITDLYRSGTVLTSVCTGAMLIAAAGLLDGRRATTHHGAIEELRHSGAQIIDARVVDDGDIITAGGVTAGIDLGLYLVERFISHDLANQCAANLEYERRGPVHVRARSGAQAKGQAAR
jgi:transcriptional regulator GlxA family with amidase domain